MAEHILKPGNVEDRIPPQVMVDFASGESALYDQWVAWLREHGQDPHRPYPSHNYTEGFGEFSSFCWIFDEDVLLAYRLRWM